MTDASIIEIVKTVFTFLGLATTAYFSYKAVQTGKANKETIEKVSKSIDGLLEEKTIADKAIGNKEGRAELRDESKKIIPK